MRNSVLLPRHSADGYTTWPRYSVSTGWPTARNITPGLGNHQRAYGEPAPLVRIHYECLTGDVFGSQRCDCGAQLRESVESISAAGGYVLEVVRHVRTGVHVSDSILAYLTSNNRVRRCGAWVGQR